MHECAPDRTVVYGEQVQCLVSDHTTYVRSPVRTTDPPPQGDPNLNADYRLKETADGRVCFESVTCPGSFVTIMGGESALNLFNVVSCHVVIM